MDSFLKEAGKQSEDLIDSGKKTYDNLSDNETFRLQVLGTAEKLSESINKLEKLYTNFNTITAEEGESNVNL